MFVLVLLCFVEDVYLLFFSGFDAAAAAAAATAAVVVTVVVVVLLQFLYFLIVLLIYSVCVCYYCCSCRFVGKLEVKASASRAEDPGFESRLRRDFPGVESYQ